MTEETKTKPRAFTQKEVTDKFMKHYVSIVRYWRDLPDLSMNRRFEGLAFSLLTALDGSSCDLNTAFHVIPMPHPTDKAYHQEQGENWWPDPPPELEEAVTVHGSHMLHDLYYNYLKREKQHQGASAYQRAANTVRVAKQLEKECEEEGYTDTGEAWLVIRLLSSAIKDMLGQPLTKKEMDQRSPMATTDQGSPGVEQGECFVDTVGGQKLVFPNAAAEPDGASYVRIIDEHGHELVYWDNKEWQEAPEEVMGALMGAVSNGAKRPE